MRRRSRHASRRRHVRINIVRPSGARDSFGDATPATDPVRTCYASIEPKRGGEQFHEGRYEGRTMYDVSIPEGTRPKVDDHILWTRAGDAVTLEIADIQDGTGADRGFDLVAVETEAA